MAFNMLKNSRYMQYISAFAATMSLASSSIYVTWASPSIPKLTSEDSPTETPLSPKEASWVVSSLVLGSILTTFVSGLIVEKLGPRVTLLISSIPLFVPWIVIIFAKSVAVLIIARFVAGTGVILTYVAAPMYNGEIADNDVRGKLGLSCHLLMSLGGIFVLSVGPFVSYRALALSCSAIPVVFVAMFYFMPDSPYYLVKIGKIEAARQNLIRLSSRSFNENDIANRLKEIQSTVAYDMQNKSNPRELLKLDYRKSLAVMFGLKTLQQCSGLIAIEAYTQTIIQLSNSSVSPEKTSVIAGVIQIPIIIIAAILVDKLGRKPLLITSAIGCVVALSAEGTFFYLQDSIGANVENITWLPPAALIGYVIMVSLGVYSLPFVFIGELFATNIKGHATAVMDFYGSCLAFLTLKLFEPISRAWGMHAIFWIYAGFCALGLVFVVFVVTETKGKTFAEIQEKLNTNRRAKSFAAGHVT